MSNSYLIITQPLFSPEGTKEELNPESHSQSMVELNLNPGNLLVLETTTRGGTQIPVGAQGATASS